MEETKETTSVEVTTEETGTAMPEETAREPEDLTQEELTKIADDVFDDAPKETAEPVAPAESELSLEPAAEVPAETTAETVEAEAEPQNEAQPDAVPSEEAPQEDTQKPGIERDFKSEFLELGKAYPELVGKQIPDEVFREAVTSGKTVLSCYHTHLIHEQQRELEQLRSEVKILRQNADNARRAPVGSLTDHAPAAKASNPYELAWEKA